MVPITDGGITMKRFLATAVTAAVLATGGVAVAGAATGSNGSGSTSSSGSPAPAASTEAGVKAAHPRLRAATAAFKIAADTIGVSPAELRKEVMAGKTIAQVAEAHNVDAK